MNYSTADELLNIMEQKLLFMLIAIWPYEGISTVQITLYSLSNGLQRGGWDTIMFPLHPAYRRQPRL